MEPIPDLCTLTTNLQCATISYSTQLGLFFKIGQTKFPKGVRAGREFSQLAVKMLLVAMVRMIFLQQKQTDTMIDIVYEDDLDEE